MTGRGMGYCNANRPANNARPLGLGFRHGCGGRGRGFRNRFFDTPVPASSQDDQIAQMQARIEELQDELTTMRQQHENSDNQR
jgi:hypothetical protein